MRAVPVLLLVSALCIAQRRPVDRFPAGVPGIDWRPLFDSGMYEEMSARCQSARTPVIVYHNVVRDEASRAVPFDVTAAEFERDMQYLVDAGVKPVPLAALHEHLARGVPLPPGAIVLTFDDAYQGFADNAYPVLKRFGFTAAVFAHTMYVGDRSGESPKMDWDTLRRLDREGLVTIGSHTVSHPADLRVLSRYALRKELDDSRAVLAKRLGRPVPYLAYPDGASDQRTWDIARDVGYTMAFSTTEGPAEESPGILCVNRYPSSELRNARLLCDERERLAPAAAFDEAIKTVPIRLEVGVYAGIKMAFVRGGVPVTRRSPVRQSVGEFILSAGGQAGINGTFFVDSRIMGTGSDLIGPSRTGPDGPFVPETDAYRLTVLNNRPLVVIGPKRIGIVPYQSAYMNTERSIRTFMPDYTDLFLAGAWIVHDGAPRTSEEMTAFGAHDLDDPRRRAFFGVTADGEIVLGASLQVIKTSALARAAAAAGVSEAVLLDSGFSTSLVFGDRIIVTGHTAKNIPSRPVPHAIVLFGQLTPITDPLVDRYVREGMATIYDGLGSDERGHRRRRHKADVDLDVLAPNAPTGTPDAPPDTAPDSPPVQQPDPGLPQ